MMGCITRPGIDSRDPADHLDSKFVGIEVEILPSIVLLRHDEKEDKSNYCKASARL